MKENMQARDRSSRILAALSAAFGGIFTCNANKTETTVGYGTLYGDLAGAFAATADLWKYQIYDLGRNSMHGMEEPSSPKASSPSCQAPNSPRIRTSHKEKAIL